MEECINIMRQMNKPKFNNLHKLLPTQESREQLSEAINISHGTINKWLDQNSRVVPNADSLVAMSKYFGCTVNYLLDLSDRR